MSYVNSVLRPLFDLLLYPFRSLPPLVGLVLVSLAAAVGMLLVFKATSNQDHLAVVKRRIHAGLFEIRLFSDDLRAILRAQGEILRYNLSYLRLSLVPMVWMILPLFFVIAQLQFHYGYDGLSPGSTALLIAELKEGSEQAADASPSAPGKPSIRLRAPEGLRIDAPPVWVPSLRQMAWRIEAVEPGDYEVAVQVGDRFETKSIVVGSRVMRRSPIRVEPGIIAELVYPAEPPLSEDGPLRSITIDYPDRSIAILGMELHWLVVFFVLAIAVAFILRGPLKVTV
jgi:hypothetical protein